MDITMCSGEKCPMKKNCKRYVGKKSLIYQSYFMVPPFVSDEEIHCDYYLPTIEKQ